MKPNDDQTRTILRVLEEAHGGEYPRIVRLFERDFVLHEGVFSPLIGTPPIHEALGPLVGRELLEIGCGAGVLPVLAAIRGARRVVGTDINPNAVENTRENALRHGVDAVIDAREGSLFAPIGADERFDIVFWNTPFNFTTERELSMLERAAFDPGYANIRQYIMEGPRFLKEGGRLLIQFSTALGRLDLIEEFAREAGLSLSLAARYCRDENIPVDAELFELR